MNGVIFMKAESGLGERAANALGIPGETGSLPTVFVTGCREVRVERHKGLLDFSDREVSLACGQVGVRIRGENLTIAGMCRGDIRLRGRIAAVEFIYPEGENAEVG